MFGGDDFKCHFKIQILKYQNLKDFNFTYKMSLGNFI